MNSPASSGGTSSSACVVGTPSGPQAVSGGKLGMWLAMMFIALPVLLLIPVVVSYYLPQPAGAITFGVVLLTAIAIGYKAIAGKSSSGGTAHAPAGGHGGHGSEGGVIALCALLFVGGVCFLFAEFTQVKLLNEQGAQKRDAERIKMLPPPPMAEKRYSVEVPTDREIALPIPIGMTCDTDPVNAGQKVWVRYEGSVEKFQDWKGRASGGTRFRNGANYKYLQSAEGVPVLVEVYVHKTD